MDVDFAAVVETVAWADEDAAVVVDGVEVGEVADVADVAVERMQFAAVE